MQKKKLKLWLLRPVGYRMSTDSSVYSIVGGCISDVQGRDNLWSPWYDCRFGFVIRAESEEAARKIAHKHAGNENLGYHGGRLKRRSPWLSEIYSTCVELTAEGKVGIVIFDEARS